MTPVSIAIDEAASTIELGVRPKRPANGYWAWTEKIYIPCPMHTKSAFARTARESGMSQAELGLAIVERFLERRKLLEELMQDGPLHGNEPS